MNDCPRCHQWNFRSAGECGCQRFELAEHGDDWRPVWAYDEQSAVEQWAERDDAESAEYLIVRGNPAQIMVRGADGAITKWEVEGESVPQYHASQIDEKAHP